MSTERERDMVSKAKANNPKTHCEGERERRCSPVKEGKAR